MPLRRGTREDERAQRRDGSAGLERRGWAAPERRLASPVRSGERVNAKGVLT